MLRKRRSGVQIPVGQICKRLLNKLA